MALEDVAGLLRCQGCGRRALLLELVVPMRKQARVTGGGYPSATTWALHQQGTHVEEENGKVRWSLHAAGVWRTLAREGEADEAIYCTGAQMR